MLCLSLTYFPETGQPFRIATIQDSGLLRQAASQAIREAERRAAVVDEVDSLLGAVEREEATRLRRVMGLFLPSCNRSHADADTII